MKNRRGFPQFLFDEKGTAAIEFGLVGAFLSLLMIGSVGFGMGYWEHMQVGNAARAGAEYAIANGSSWTTSAIPTSAIQNAVTSATSLSGVTATVPAPICGCPTASGGITTMSGTPPACSASCASGGTAGSYVTITAQASTSTICIFCGVIDIVGLVYPGLPTTLTASMTVRYN